MLKDPYVVLGRPFQAIPARSANRNQPRNGCLADAATAAGRVLLRSQLLHLHGQLQPLAPGTWRVEGLQCQNASVRRRHFLQRRETHGWQYTSTIEGSTYQGFRGSGCHDRSENKKNVSEIRSLKQ